jgi:hypothetical protein
MKHNKYIQLLRLTTIIFGASMSSLHGGSVEGPFTVSLTTYEEVEQPTVVKGTITTMASKIVVTKITNRTIIDQYAIANNLPAFSKSASIVLKIGRIDSDNNEFSLVIRDRGNDYPIEFTYTEIDGPESGTEKYDSAKKTFSGSFTAKGISTFEFAGIKVSGLTTTSQSRSGSFPVRYEDDDKTFKSLNGTSTTSVAGVMTEGLSEHSKICTGIIKFIGSYKP